VTGRQGRSTFVPPGMSLIATFVRAWYSGTVAKRATTGAIMFKWISAAAGACALGLPTLQSISTAAVLGAGLFTLSPTLIPASAHADVLPGWRRPCSACKFTWRGGAPFRYGGNPGSTVTTRVSGGGKITATAERTYSVNGRTYVVRTTVVRTYSVRSEK